MASLSLRNICKVYPNGFEAVKDFNLEIEDKEFVIFVGPSGCGKSTTLRMIAGLEDISSGELYIGDRLVNDVEPKDRDIAMVFQNYALYPHMTVYDNMAFGLKLRKVPKAEMDKAVKEAVQKTQEKANEDIEKVRRETEAKIVVTFVNNFVFNHGVSPYHACKALSVDYDTYTEAEKYLASLEEPGEKATEEVTENA